MPGELVIIFGVSGSGKDTAANFLFEQLPSRSYIVKFGEPMKHLFQYGYSLPDLNSPAGKLASPIHYDGSREIRTAQEMMVTYHHVMEKYFPYLYPSHAFNRVMEEYKEHQKRVFIFNDVRTLVNADVILHLKHYLNLKPHYYRIVGRGDIESSDNNVNEAMSMFDDIRPIYNEGSLENYKDQLKTVAKEVYGSLCRF